MKSLKFKIPIIFVAISLLVVAGGIKENIMKYSVFVVAIMVIIISSYIITKDIIEYIDLLNQRKVTSYERISRELKNSIDKFNNEQRDNINNLVQVEDCLNESTEQYINKIDDITKIQNKLIDEGNKLIEEVQFSNNCIQKMLDVFCRQISDNISDAISTIENNNQNENRIINDSIELIIKQNEKHEENLENIIAELLDSINKNVTESNESIKNVLNDFTVDFSEVQKKADENEIKHMELIKELIETYLNDIKKIATEEKNILNALKARVEVSLKQVNEEIKNQTSSIEEGLDDHTDDISEIIKSFSAEQKSRDEKQNATINNQLKDYNSSITEQIKSVLDANKELMEYIQKVQEDWTSLSKDEIAFLNKVWNE